MLVYWRVLSKATLRPLLTNLKQMWFTISVRWFWTPELSACIQQNQRWNHKTPEFEHMICWLGRDSSGLPFRITQAVSLDVSSLVSFRSGSTEGFRKSRDMVLMNLNARFYTQFVRLNSILCTNCCSLNSKVHCISTSWCSSSLAKLVAT